MTILRLVLGDQLNQQITSLRDLNSDDDIVLMAEVGAEVTYVKHHKRKIAFLWAGMRHFADELRQAGATHRQNAASPQTEKRFCVCGV